MISTNKQTNENSNKKNLCSKGLFETWDQKLKINPVQNQAIQEMIGEFQEKGRSGFTKVRQGD